MGKRKLPFGYQLSNGKICTHPQETRIVQSIFERYIAGESFQELTAFLRECGICYADGKLWNKNMVARILDDPRYLGKDVFPQLIDQTQFRSAKEIRRSKERPSQKTTLQKLLCRLSDERLSAFAEQAVLGTLNYLWAHPELINAPAESDSMPETVAGQKVQVLLKSPLTEEDHVRTLILQATSERYESLSNDAYESQRIRHLLHTSSDINAESVAEIMEKIALTPTRIALHLWNRQIIEKGIPHE